MTGKAYYITTLADWQRHAARFANSHFIVLDTVEGQGFLALSEGEGSHDITTRAKHDSSGGRSFSSDISDGREAPSLLPQAVHKGPPGLRLVEPGRSEGECPERHDSSVDVNRAAAPRTCPEAVEDSRRILVLIEADEGVHLSLDDDPAFEPLPHPLAQKPIPATAQSALAPHGVAPGATTFDAMETLARVHPLLRHRVF